MAILKITGFEHGVASTNGAGLFDALTGPPTVQNTTVRTGTYALQCGGASTQYARIQAATPTYLVGRFYFYNDATPTAGARVLFRITTGSPDYDNFFFTIQTDGDLEAQITGGAAQSYSSISTGTWYRLDFRLYCGSTSYTIDWQVNGSAQTQATHTASGASSFDYYDIGDPWNALGEGINYFYDDFILSDATGDYPFGAGQVDGLSPDADGTHNNGGSDIEDNDGNVIDGTTAYDHINKVPLSEATVYLQQVSNDDAAYVEVTFPDINATSVNGAMGLLAYNSAATQANEGACYTVDSEATNTEIWGVPPDGNQKDYSESAFFYKSAVITEPSGGWDDAEVDALKMRMGHSGDANPDPYWRNVMIEVDYVAGAAPPSAFIPRVIFIG